MSTLDASLAHFPKITYQRYQKLVAYFSDLKNLWQAELPEMINAGLPENIAAEFIEWREQNPTDKIMERLNKESIQTISLGDPGYPKLLAEITDPPFALFVRGKLDIDDTPTVAIVGARKHTGYGEQMAQCLSADLAAKGMGIISGLAIGIDGIAHTAALSANGKTVAVLGSGVDRSHIYPASNRQLAERIIENGGAVISEYPPGFLPAQFSFPARNRIIAGLSLATIIIEAAEHSGSLITASCALDYNREVFAVPHPATSVAGVGGNNLIKQGAKLIASAADVIEALNLMDITSIVENRQTIPSSPLEEKILNTLSKEPKHIDEIIKSSGLSGSLVMSTLTIMEMKKQVIKAGGMKYILGV